MTAKMMDDGPRGRGRGTIRARAMGDKGFSLVELLVAVCILAAAAIPMIGSFLAATRSNSKARERLTATMVAEDVMEGIKSRDHEELIQELRDYADGRTDRISALADGVAERHPGSPTSVTIEEDDGDVTIYMRDLHAESAADHAYDALIRMSASAYRGDGAASYNSIPLASAEKMDSVHSAIFHTDSYDQDLNEAVKSIRMMYPDRYPDITPEDLSRLMTVRAEKAPGGSDGADRVQASATVGYYLESFSRDRPIFEKRFPIYDNIDTAGSGGTLNDVYVFYYPGYEMRPAGFVPSGSGYAMGGAAHDDTIAFENPDSLPVTLYVIKQPRDGGNLAVQELGYDPYVMIREGPGDEMATKVCSNLDVNLADGSTLSRVSAEGNFKIEPLGKAPEGGLDPFNGLVGKTSDRMFRVDVGIYEAGAADAGFPKGRRLAHLRSTKAD